MDIINKNLVNKNNIMRLLQNFYLNQNLKKEIKYYFK
jgi:hypothetical protein